MAPWPTSIATRSPALRTSAARCRSASRGRITGSRNPTDDGTAPWARGGSEYSASWMSLGTITQVTDRVALAMRMARSMRWAACSGAMHTCTNSLATSLNRVVRSTSCWKLDPSAMRACWPTMATTGAWSSLAS